MVGCQLRWWTPSRTRPNPILCLIGQMVLACVSLCWAGWVVSGAVIGCWNLRRIEEGWLPLGEGTWDT